MNRVSTAIAITIILQPAMESLAAPSKAPSKPTMATALDVFGNPETQHIERELEKLQAQYPRRNTKLSEKEADAAYKKANDLVNHVTDMEQLIRLAYWAHEAHPSPYDSDVEIVFGSCYSAMHRIKKLYPERFHSPIYEIAMLLRADGGTGEVIDGLLAQNPDEWPARRPPGVYVDVDGIKDASTPALLALHFNITRKLWSAWKPHWSGKYRFQINTSFEIDERGLIKAGNLNVSTNGKSEAAKYLEKIRSLIKSNQPYGPIEGRKPVHVQVNFYG